MYIEFGLEYFLTHSTQKKRKRKENVTTRYTCINANVYTYKHTKYTVPNT